MFALQNRIWPDYYFFNLQFLKLQFIHYLYWYSILNLFVQTCHTLVEGSHVPLAHAGRTMLESICFAHLCLTCTFMHWFCVLVKWVSSQTPHIVHNRPTCFKFDLNLSVGVKYNIIYPRNEFKIPGFKNIHEIQILYERTGWQKK